VQAARDLAQLLERVGELLRRRRDLSLRLLRPALTSASAIRSRSAIETSRCCAPSWRLRSSRLRSASPTATMRARDAASCSWASALAIAWAASSANA